MFVTIAIAILIRCNRLDMSAIPLAMLTDIFMAILALEALGVIQ